ncbi:MAG: hypothetical protein EZS28_051293, partial [Streblomastix strix]
MKLWFRSNPPVGFSYNPFSQHAQSGSNSNASFGSMFPTLGKDKEYENINELQPQQLQTQTSETNKPPDVETIAFQTPQKDEDYVGQQKKEKDLKKKMDKSDDDETNDFFSQQMKMVKVKRKREQGREDDSNSNNEDEDESDSDSDSVDDQIRNIDEDSAEEYIRSFQQQRKDEEEIEQELRRK